MKKYDMSSVTSIFSGAAPLGAETAKELQGVFPSWAIRQGYGMIYLDLDYKLSADVNKA